MSDIEQARREWLKHYTWVQPDGGIDFSNPRLRPEGLALDPREEKRVRRGLGSEV